MRLCPPPPGLELPRPPRVGLSAPPGRILLPPLLRVRVPTSAALRGEEQLSEPGVRLWVQQPGAAPSAPGVLGASRGPTEAVRSVGLAGGRQPSPQQRRAQGRAAEAAGRAGCGRPGHRLRPECVGRSDAGWGVAACPASGCGHGTPS